MIYGAASAVALRWAGFFMALVTLWLASQRLRFLFVFSPLPPHPIKGQAMREKLKRPRAITCAAQCREMGVAVGDTIVGRETHANGDWNEAKLTALFIGREECVFQAMRRSNYEPRWASEGESASWSLNCRDWYKLIPATREDKP